MSEERIFLDYLNDILESISDIKEFTDRKEYLVYL